VNPATAESTQPSRTRNGSLRAVAFAALILVAALVAMRLGWFDARRTLDGIRHLRETRDTLAFAVLFVLIYSVFTALGVPGTPFTIAAGAIFGALPGAVLARTGAMFSAAIGYWIARRMGYDLAMRLLRNSCRIKRAMVQSRELSGMLRLRLLPFLPLGVVNFVGGLAHTRFGSYLVATAIGSIPSIFLFAYFADALVATGSGARHAAVSSILLASFLLAGLALAPKLLRSSRR
jgi:uncharacterized membrane protein YdjX (TVP38/TMEM64 family)